MEIVLAKFYLILVFIILLIGTVSVLLQVRLKQNLEKNLTRVQSQISTKEKSYEDQFKLGQIYLRKKIYNRAILEFRECFENWDKDDRIGLASLLNTLGFTYYNLKQYNIAIYYYKMALSITPDYFRSLTNLAYLYQSRGKLERLNGIYKELKKLDPNNPKTIEIESYLNFRLNRDSRI